MNYEALDRSTYFSTKSEKKIERVTCRIRAVLTHTDVPVNVIRDKVGYTNQANFNRQFKAYKRVSPSEYRSAIKRYR
ncbi:helix-turn-helix domain-containing protein [Vibrio furnissii]|uniref:helix-turn-helix domain-containing protein n=1 Tax=Vibrio furnissii TaxID=29494 RepID=UPI003B975C28